MKLRNPDEIQVIAIEALGLDPAALDLSSVEAIACALRRVAGSLCPCPARTLVEAVSTSLRELVEDSTAIRKVIEDTLEAIVANGDLFEASEVDPSRTNQGALLYLVPPAFVRRQSGTLFLLGVLPDGTSPLPNDLSSRVEYVNHLRMLQGGSDASVADNLLSLGFFEMSGDCWLKMPQSETASQHLRSMNALLDTAGEVPMFPGLQILVPQKPVRYYRDRWEEPAERNGRFIARRPQAYGAAIWCYVQINGDMVKLVDFPLMTSQWRGCDDALRLQAAIDAERHHPQTYRIRRGPGATELLDLFSPIPMWARRRYESIGEPIMASDCLLTYKFRRDELEQERQFLTEYLWLAEERHSDHESR